MKSKAYEDWVSLYNDDLIEVWHQERNELKMTSMILYVLKRELNRIQKEAEQDVAKTRRCLQQRDELDTTMPPSISFQESKNDKEKIANLWSSACLGVKPLEDVAEDIQSPEIFRIASPKNKTANMGHGFKENETSPTIKKRMKRPRCKLNQNLSPSLLHGGNAKENVQASPAPNNLINMELRTPENTFTMQNKTNLDHALIDSTIIDSTPCAPSTKKSKSFGRGRSYGKQLLLSLNKPSKRVKCRSNDTTCLPNQTNTLTQMLSRDVKKVKEESIILESSDEDSQKSMNISDILAYVDKHQMVASSPKKSASASNDPKRKSDEYAAAKDNMSQDCFIRDIHKSDIIAKLPTLKQGIREHQNNLDGWSCHDCEVFYGKLNLARDDLDKKMDECFKRHRKFKLHQETYAGFWDVGMPTTPESQLTREQSTVFHP